MATHPSSIFSEPFNKWLRDNRICDCWETAAITLVPKKGSSKFGLIACALVALKVLEQLFLPHVTSYPNISDLHQFAYRPSRFTFDALVTPTHFISSALNMMFKGVRIRCLDYSEVFCYADRNKVFSFLSRSSVESSFISLLGMYFHSRQQFTRYNGTVSSLILSIIGVPQGATLSLSFLCLSSLPTHIHNVFISYADDVVPGLL